MTKFIFKSTLFNLTLEDYDNPVEIFSAVVEGIPKELQAKAPKMDEKSEKASTNSNEMAEVENPDYQDIDEYFGDNRPTSIRDLLEKTAQYMTEVEGLSEFSENELFEKCKTSEYYEAPWSKNRSATIKRMIKSNFLVKRPNSKLKVK